MNCINVNDKNYIELLEQTKLNPLILKARISIFQDKNGLESFPKVEDIIQSNETLNKVNFTDVIDNNESEIFNQSKAEPQIIKTNNQNKQLLFGENNSNTVEASVVLTNLIKSDVFDKIKEGDFFLEKAFNLLNKSGASLKLIDSKHPFYKKFDSKTVMLYDAVTNDIYVSQDSLDNFSQYDIVSAFIHEVVHSTTVKAYFNPKTIAEWEFRRFIDKAFEQYKHLATKRDADGNLMYGFTNQAEFIAEIYSNPEFRKEIQSIEKNWLEKLIDVIRRMFDMSKNIMNQELIRSTVLFNKVEEFAEKDMSKWKGTLVRDPRYERFGTTFSKEVQKPSNATLEDKLTNLLNHQLNNVEQVMRRALSANKKYGSKNQNFITKVEQLKESLKVAQRLDKLEGINNYADFMIEQINSIFKDLKNNSSKLETLETIEKYQSYLGATDLLKATMDTLDDVRILNLSEDEKIFVEEIQDKLTEVSGKHDRILSKFKNYRVDNLRKELRSSYYVEKVVKDFRDELSKEYPKNSSLSKNEWINQEVLNRQEELDSRIDKELNEVIDGIAPDISAWDKWIYSTLNTKSRLIQLTQKVISKMKSKIDELIRDNDFKLKKLNDDLIAEKGSYDISNLLETDSNGETFLKGKYSLEFRNKYINEYSKYLDELSEVTSRLNREGKSTLNNPEVTEINKKLKNWLDTNTKTIKGQKIPIDKYLTNIKLSKAEQAIYDEYIKLAKNSEKVFGKSGSLIKRSLGITYYSLPYKTISGLERVMTGKVNVVDTLKQKKSEFLDWKIDDIDQYEKMYDSSGTQIFNIPVMFRNNLDKDSKEYKQSLKEQSLDLLTLMRLEHFNQTNFKVKSENEMLLNTIVDISKEKDYVKTEAGTNNLVSNLFGVQTKYVTFKGIQSNEYKRLQSIIQQSLYNVFKEEGVKIAGKDSNKIVQFINKHTSFLGMSLNYFNAPVNVLNGEFQTFLLRVAKDIDKGNLRSAHIEYSKDLANIVADTGRPVKLSKINQLNNIMDIFGGLTHDQQDFIKNSILKGVTDPQMLQILQNGGEHLVQSVLNIALMKSVKVMNDKGQYVNKDGKVVSEKDSASLYDMVEQDKDTKQVTIDNSKFEYTSLSTVTKWKEGGFENVRLYVKKKIFDTMGEYDKNFQNEIQKHWWGQLLIMYKKFLIPLGLTRYRGGVASAFKSKDKLTEDDKHWNEALQQYEEGYYITTARLVLGGMFSNGIAGALNNLKYSILKSKWEELSEYEKANVRKGITELGFLVLMNMIILPLLMGMAGDDDDDSLWYLAMIGRRLEQELSQYTNLQDAYKITRNPIASLNLIEDMINVSKFAVTPTAWFSETKDGDLRLYKALEKVAIPSALRPDRDSKTILRHMNRELIRPYEDSMFYKIMNE